MPRARKPRTQHAPLPARVDGSPFVPNVRAYPGQVTNVARFPSVQAAYAAACSAGAHGADWLTQSARNVRHYGTPNPALATLVRDGDPDGAARIATVAALANKLKRPVRAISQVQAGGCVLVPACLANDPRAFIRPIPTRGAYGKVRIYADITVSESVTADRIATRGGAIMALAVALARVRPVELHVYAAMKHRAGNGSTSVMSWRVPIGTTTSGAADLSSAALSLTNAASLRRIMFALGALGSSAPGTGGIQWPWDDHPGNVKYDAAVRSALALSADDVTFTGGHADMRDLWADPEAWVRARYAELSAR